MKDSSINESREHVNLAKRDWRFERCARLFGSEAMSKLSGSHVAIFGLGGVGSYVAEGLARSGVGRLTLVDFDKVCITNINRQLHAVTATVGQSKAELMTARVLAINPKLTVRACTEFYDKDTSASLLEPRPDVVVDCIDNVTAKVHLVATCCEQKIPVVSALGASAKLDPTRVRVVPLTETHSDGLGRVLRKFLRNKHGVSDELLEKVVAVFSDEPALMPQADPDGIACGVNCVCPDSDNAHHTCKGRHVILGSLVCVTATFGLAAASAVVRMLIGISPFSPEENAMGKMKRGRGAKPDSDEDAD